MHVRYPSRVAGITEPNRQRLATLHRAFPGPFSAAEAARVLATDQHDAGRFLAYLAARGWLARIRPNLYMAVPLEAERPSDWREDPWVVAAATFAPCYIGGWSAAEYWDLTEQVFREILVISAHPVRDRHPTVQGTAFRVKTVKPELLFGLEVVWRGRNPVEIADPTRTVVDLLADPSLGGGIRHVGDILAVYLASDRRDDALLVDYAERVGNRTAFKRLGYLLEALGLDAPKLIAASLARLSQGYSLLDPNGPRQGRLLRRWNLRLNSQLEPVEICM